MSQPVFFFQQVYNCLINFHMHKSATMSTMLIYISVSSDNSHMCHVFTRQLVSYVSKTSHLKSVPLQQSLNCYLCFSFI